MKFVKSAIVGLAFALALVSLVFSYGGETQNPALQVAPVAEMPAQTAATEPEPAMVTSTQIYLKNRTMNKNETLAFAKVLPSGAADGPITYSSTDPNVVTVSADGKIYAAGAGTATVTCTAADGSRASCEITVTAPAASVPVKIDPEEYAAEVLRLTNQKRAENGVPALSGKSKPLNSAAMARANELIEYFSHIRPDGSICFTMFDEMGVVYGMAGENIAMGQKTPAIVVQDWMDSEGHKKNMLNPGFRSMGAGVAIDSGGRIYWVQLFTD